MSHKKGPTKKVPGPGSHFTDMPIATAFENIHNSFTSHEEGYQ